MTQVPSTEYRVSGSDPNGDDQNGTVRSRALGTRYSVLFPRPKTLWQLVQLPFTWAAILLVRLYQLGISPGLPSSCRFAPSCSQYMLEALQRHHALKGIMLGTWRLLRCHPWHPGGYDPVP